MAQYNEYTESGQQWLGKVPSHWKIIKLRGVFDENTTQNFNHAFTKQLQFKFGTIIPKVLNYDADDADWSIIEKYSIVQPNDIVINGLNLNYDFNSHRVGLVIEEGIITSAYIVIRPKENFNPSYLNYALKGWDSRKLLHGMGTGVRITLSWKELKNYSMPIPPADEQAGIVAYLDKVTADIDKAIAAKERIISVLEERRKIIITEAVTHGINPDAPLRDSGIDWLGQIPAHWEVRKLKHVAKISHGTDPKLPGNIPVYGSGSESFRTCGEFKEGPCLLLGRKGSVNNPQYITGKYWNVDTAFDVKSDESILLLRLLFFMSLCFDYNKYSTQTAVPSMTQSAYNNIQLAFGNIDEQRDILHYLEQQNEELNYAISQQRKAIDLLRERKAIIINEVVTGKVKVV